MPHFLGNILVVKKDELVPRFFPTYEALKVKLWRDAKKEGYGMRRKTYGGNCRKLLVVFDSLPKRWQNQIGDPRKNKHPLSKFYKVDPKAVLFYNDFQYPDKKYLTPHAVEKYITNASVLSALVQLEAARESERIAKGGSLRGITGTLYTDAHNFNAILLKKYDIEHSLNSNLRRFKEQFKDFKDRGYISVIKDANGKGKKNALKRDAKTNNLLNALFAGRTHKPTATEVAREYEAFINGYIEVTNQTTGEIYDPKNYKEIGNRTITNYLATYESKIGTYAKRSGDRQKLMQDTIPYETLEQPKFAGSMISIDDRQPPFWYEKGKRMWWYLGIDLASEAITAWAFGKTKEELIINFYRQMVRNYHAWGLPMPDALECESSLNSSFKNTFLKNGAMFNNVQIHPNSARSKRIEGYFKPLRYEIEKEQEGWIARPFAKAEANQAGAEKTPIIPYEKLTIQGFKNIQTWNNMANKQAKKEGITISRFDYFLQHQHPNLQPTNWKGFLKYVGFPTPTSCKAGIMKLQRKEWLLGDKNEIYTGENLVTLLKEVEGKDIDIYWLDDDAGAVIKALVYDKNGRYICEALPKPVSARAPIEASANHKEAREIMSRYRNTVTAYQQLQKNSIDKVVITKDDRTKTVSTSFVIPGYETFIPRTEPVEEIENTSEEPVYIPKQKHANGLANTFFN